MKYCLIITSQADAGHWNGKVVKVVEKDTTGFRFESLCEGICKNEKCWCKSVQKFYISGAPERFKDVTHIYVKIIKLFDAMNNAGGDDDFDEVCRIKDKFEEGHYPTKSKFNFMNRIWGEIN